VLVAAAICPHPPLLIPAAMGAAGLDGAGPADAGPDGAAPADAELRGVRASCAAAVAGLLAAGPDLLVVVGGAARGAVYVGHAAGSLRDFGITVAVGSGEPVLPLSLTVGAWLLDQAGEGRAAGQPGEGRTAGQPGGGRAGGGRAAGQAGGGRAGGGRAAGRAGTEHPAGQALRAHPAGQPGTGPARCALPCRLLLRAVPTDMPPANCLRLGAELAGLAPRVALLAMGDASARKAVGVHGVADPAADSYDAEAAAALAAADTGTLARLDPALDDELMIAGRAAWQVLAGAADGAALRGRLRCAVAPYDVSYLVASWQNSAAARPDRSPSCAPSPGDSSSSGVGPLAD